MIYSYTDKKAEIRYLPNKLISIYIDGELVKYKELLTVTEEAVKSENKGLWESCDFIVVL